MSFGHESDVSAADILLRATRDLANLGRLARGDGRMRAATEYSATHRGRSGAGHEPELTTYGRIEATLMSALIRVVDDNAERAQQLRQYLCANSEYLVAGALLMLSREWFPLQCWNGRCLIEHCAGIDHVDATGIPWCQREGFVCHPKTGQYDLPEGADAGSVKSLYRREASVGETL